MFIEITITAAVLFNLKPGWKATDGLTAEMGNHCLRSKKDRMASFPNTQAEVHFLAVIEKLFVESAQALEKVAAKHYAATGLPVYCTFGVAEPVAIFFIGEECGDPGEAKSRYPITPDSRKESSRYLIRSVGIQNAATEGAGFRMTVSKFDKSIQSAIAKDGIRI